MPISLLSTSLESVKLGKIHSLQTNDEFSGNQDFENGNSVNTLDDTSSTGFVGNGHVGSSTGFVGSSTGSVGSSGNGHVGSSNLENSSAEGLDSNDLKDSSKRGLNSGLVGSFTTDSANFLGSSTAGLKSADLLGSAGLNSADLLGSDAKGLNSAYLLNTTLLSSAVTDLTSQVDSIATGLISSAPDFPSQTTSLSSSPKSSTPKNSAPFFDYDLTIFNQLLKYIETNNHHGLALISRQKGIPPFLRFKIWPTLLKYHSHVRNPFIQPDIDNDDEDEDEVKGKEVKTEVKNGKDKEVKEEIADALTNESSIKTSPNESSSNGLNTHANGHILSSKSSGDETNDESKKQNIKSNNAKETNNQDSSTNEESSKQDYNSIESDKLSAKELEILKKIRKDLLKYIQRLRYSSEVTLNDTEKTFFEVLEHAILKFSLKWMKIIKYDQSLAWMALNLAEWFPPISNTPWVLCGRDHTSSHNSLITNILEDYLPYIESTNSSTHMNKFISEDNMKFSSVYERVVLVLLHSAAKKSPEVQNKTLLPLNGGSIEERVSFFIYGLRKLLPELSRFFSDEQILARFGSHDDEWLIWWLKFAGSKVWSKYDRGRVWDLMFGWRLKNPKKPLYYYLEKLETDAEFINRLGPDIFWTLNNEDEDVKGGKEESSAEDSEGSTLHKNSSFKNLVDELSSPKSKATSSLFDIPDFAIPFSKLDPQFELIFVSLALLKSKENILVELDQHEVRQYLSRLPSKPLKPQKKVVDEQEIICENTNSVSSTPPKSCIENSPTIKEDYMDKILNESGDLWRKWLWMEMVDDN